MNPWQVLGVHRETPQAAIRDKYRELMRHHHPDAGGNAALAAEITQAYKVLVTPMLLKSHLDTLTVLGTPCTTCGGKGYTYKQRGITERTTSACASCGGRGIALKDGL